MCTILILYQAHPAAPLIIAANRDELYARASAAPTLLHESPVRSLGGRDLTAGGTWMGLNERGLVVGLTNYTSFDRDRRSRGEIAIDALGCRSPDEVDTMLRERVTPGSYRPFNLLFGTADDLRVARFFDDSLQVRPVTPGLHVLPSGAGLDDSSSAKVSHGGEGLRRAARSADIDALFVNLSGVLADHRVGHQGSEFLRQIRAVCVHTDEYGTRSSTLIAVGGDTIRYDYADGPPCQTEFVAYGHLLA